MILASELLAYAEPLFNSHPTIIVEDYNKLVSIAFPVLTYMKQQKGGFKPCHVYSWYLPVDVVSTLTQKLYDETKEIDIKEFVRISIKWRLLQPRHHPLSNEEHHQESLEVSSTELLSTLNWWLLLLKCVFRLCLELLALVKLNGSFLFYLISLINESTTSMMT
ncbi:hypothetical protein GEMRC1_001255 [Eukaryota sp. GEM-RC1]